VLGPALAMERMPGPVCYRGKEGGREGESVVPLHSDFSYVTLPLRPPSLLKPIFTCPQLKVLVGKLGAVKRRGREGGRDEYEGK